MHPSPRSLVAAAVACLLSPFGCSAGGGGAVPSVEGAGGGGGLVSAGLPLATGIALSGVTIYQAVGVPLMQSGAPVGQRNAPVVMGKDAMVRVFVQPDADFQPRPLVARLELSSPSSGPIDALEATLEVAGPSTEANLGSTFDFDVPGADVTADVAYAVTLHEAAADAQFPGASGGATWPADGSAASIGTEDSRGNFKVTIVPYAYTGDGSGRVPDTGEKQLELFKEKFTAYPVPATEFTVHAPVNFGQTFLPNGTGWQELIMNTCNLRQQEGAARNNFYYGIIAPANSIMQFCSGGCVAGLGTQAGPNDDYARCAIGLGFTGAQTPEVALQELGHALGRLHAPCGTTQAVDNAYPYPGGGIGSWGYELPKKLLRDPGSVKDFMSYCQPVWVSDYTFRAIFDRIAYVNANAMMILPPDFPDRWRTIAVEADGSLHAGASVRLRTPPTGEPRTVYGLDAHGSVIGEAPGFFYRTHTVAGGVLVVPDAALAGATAVRIAGHPAATF